jgi:hypothetical protein
MRRNITSLLASAVVAGCAARAVAQDGLGGVTMRVLEDIGGIEAVVLELDPQAADRAPAASADADSQRSADGADRDDDVEATPDPDGDEERSEREDDGEPPDGALEGRDVDAARDAPRPDVA